MHVLFEERRLGHPCSSQISEARDEHFTPSRHATVPREPFKELKAELSGPISFRTEVLGTGHATSFQRKISVSPGPDPGTS